MNERVKTKLMAGNNVREIPGFPEDLAEALVAAHQVAPKWYVRIQAVFQSNIDNAVSKTVNLPAIATIEDVGKIFQLAYDLNCKGVTVYRDSSRENQVLSASQLPQEPNEVSLGPRPRIRVTVGKTSKFPMGCGTLFVTVNKDEKGICEVFANLGKAGGCPSQSEAT